MSLSYGDLASIFDNLSSKIEDMGNRIEHFSQAGDSMNPSELLKLQQMAGEFQTMVMLQSSIEKEFITTDKSIVQNIA